MAALIAALGTKTAGASLAQGIATGATLGKGVAALTPTASGIFSAAQPALAGLPSLAPALTQAPGIFSMAQPALAGLPSLTPGIFAKASPALAGLPSLAPTAAPGFKSLAMANAPLTPTSFNLANQTLGLGDVATKASTLRPDLIKVADVATKTAPDLSKSLLQQGAKFKAAPQLSRADLLARQAGQVPKTIEATNLAEQAAVGQRAVDFATAQKVAARSGLGSAIDPNKGFLSNAISLAQDPSMQGAMDYIETHPYASAGAAYGLYSLMQPKYKAPEEDTGMIRPYEYRTSERPEAYAAAPGDSSEQRYFDSEFVPLTPYKAKEGGLMSLAVGGPVEQMAELNSIGANTGYPMAQLNSPLYANPTAQRPEAVNSMFASGEPGVGVYTGEAKFAEGGEAETTGEYKYSYDPDTMQFTQLSAPVPAQKKGTPFGNLGSFVSMDTGFGSNTRIPTGMVPMDKYQNYMTPMHIRQKQLEQQINQKTNQPIVTGGIAKSSEPIVQDITPAYTPPPAQPYQSPEQRLGLGEFYSMMDQRLKEAGGYAAGGGVSGLESRFNLGGYSDGGRLLKGPGDGVSDSIPAVIGERQPARLADGEFVIPARIVSEIGNGSTDAGARKLYAMMDRVQKARRKTVGKGKIAANTRADKHLPA